MRCNAIIPSAVPRKAGCHGPARSNSNKWDSIACKRHPDSEPKKVSR